MQCHEIREQPSPTPGFRPRRCQQEFIHQEDGLIQAMQAGRHKGRVRVELLLVFQITSKTGFQLNHPHQFQCIAIRVTHKQGAAAGLAEAVGQAGGIQA